MAIPKPEPADWQKANAQQVRLGDQEVLSMLRDSYKRVDSMLKALQANGSTDPTVRRVQLEQSRVSLLTEQAAIFDRLGDVVSARRTRAVARSQRLSAASTAFLLNRVGATTTADAIYKGALAVSQRGIEAALTRMGLSAVPLSQKIYRTQVWMDGRLGKLINAALASGANAREFAKTARDWFNPNTPGGIRYAAMRLARTEINNAFHASAVQRSLEKPWVSQMDWNLSKSHPKPDICNKVADESPYAVADVPVRPHPQCMCFVTEHSIDEDEWVDRFIDGEFDDYLDEAARKDGFPNADARGETAAPVAAPIPVAPPEPAAAPAPPEPSGEINPKTGKEITYKKLWHISLATKQIQATGFRSGSGDNNQAHFGSGVYLFTDKSAADRYLSGLRSFVSDDYEMIEAQASVIKPFGVRARADEDDPDGLMRQALIKAKIQKASEGRLSPDEIRRRLKKAGYDGVEVKQDGFNDEVGGSQLLVFDADDAIPVPGPEEAKVIKQPEAPSFDDRLSSAAVEDAALASPTFSMAEKAAKRPAQFNRDMQLAVGRYTGINYKTVNAQLRGLPVPTNLGTADPNEIIRNLDAAMEISKTQGEIVTWRGLTRGRTFFGDRLDHDLTGMEWREDAYLSTTTVEARTRGFLSGGAPDNVRMRILVPNGTKAVTASARNLEAEVLIARGAKLKVVRDNGIDANGVRNLDMEVDTSGSGVNQEAEGAPVRGVSAPGPEGTPVAATPSPSGQDDLKRGDAAQALVPKGLFKRGSLTPEQRKEVKVYESGWFAVINSFLRGGEKIEDREDERTAKTVAVIDSAMAESVLPEPIRVYRGMFRSGSLFGDRLENDLTGFSWKELSFGSTTTEESVTDAFRLADERQDPKYAKQNVHMVIDVPAGIRAIQVSTSTEGSQANGPQAEITLQRGLKWEVTKDHGYSPEKGYRLLEVRVSLQD
jgi:hypothetical protein